MSKKAATFYVLHGDDDLSVTEAVKHMLADMSGDPNDEMNISHFDGTSASVPEIINAVSSYPFLSDKRVAVVKDLLAHLTRNKSGKKALDALADSLPTLPDYSRLILVERAKIKETNAIIKLAKTHENGYLRLYEAPKDITRWIKDRAEREYNVQIDTRAIAALATVTNNDMRLADNELVKLVSYVDEGVTITEEHVAVLTPYVPEANIFKMVDAIAEGRGELALSLLHRLLAEKENDPFKLFGMIVRQFRLLLLAKEHLTTGGSPGSIAGAIGVAPFVAQNLARQSRSFEIDQLERIYHALADYDLKMKTGRIDPPLALDLFIASIAK